MWLPRFSTLILGIAIGWLSIATGTALSATYDDFEGTQVSWTVGDADASYQMLQHQRIADDAHSGRGSEMVRISSQQGSYVYVTHAVPTPRIVAELSASVWVKANRPGIQFLARVVLPHSTDPRTGQPVTTLIQGTSYSTVGMWQQLQIADTPQLVNRQVRVLRTQMGPQVDPREAYIDQLRLNVYGGAGQTAVDIDDLELSGVVERGSDSNAGGLAGGASGVVQAATAIAPVDRGASSNGISSGGATAHQISLSGSVLSVDGRPMFPRIAQWQGEPLGWLRQQGFNAVRTSGPISDEMLAEAQRVGIWVIGPPTNPGAPGSQMVLARHLGSGLAGAELANTAAAAKQLRQASGGRGTPLVGGVDEETLAYSRLVDVVSTCRLPLGTSFDLKDYGAWLAARSRFVRPGTPLWNVVQTEVQPNLAEQAALLAGPQAGRAAIDAEGIRLLTYQSISAGMRGIEFASASRFDATDAATRLRAATIAQLNLELELMEPWGAAGTYLTTVSSNDPSIRGVVLAADTARLVVVVRLPKDSQYVAGPEWGGTDLPPMAGSVLPPRKIGNTRLMQAAGAEGRQGAIAFWNSEPDGQHRRVAAASGKRADYESHACRAGGAGCP